MKRKLILIIIFVFLLVHCLCLSVLADDVKDEIISSFGDEIRDFENSLPDYVKDSLPNDIFNFDITSPISDKLSANTILNSAIDQLFANIPSILNSVSLILIAVIISSIFNTATDGLESSAMKETYGFCSTLCISLAVFNFIGNLCIRSISYMGEICKVMTAFTPLMTAIQLVSGKLSTAALGNASFNLFIILIENVLMVFTVPIVKACFCFVLVMAISGEKDIGGIIRLIKSTFLTVTGFCMMVFSFVFSMQNILTQSADSLSMKTARFA